MAQEQQREEFLIRDKDTGQARPYYVSAENINLGDDETYKSLPTKLAEMQDEIEDAGSGDGTVTGVKVGNTPYNPDSNGVVDLSVPFNDKVDKDPNKELIPTTDLTKLQNLPTADELTQQMGAKANDANVVKSISVNGQTPQTPQNGNVNINVQTGDQVSVIQPDPADGTFIIRVGSTDYTINLNHTHEGMVKLEKFVSSNPPSSMANDTIYAQVDNLTTPTEIQSLWLFGVEFAGGYAPGTPAITSPSGSTINLGENDGSGVSGVIFVKANTYITGDLTVGLAANSDLSFDTSNLPSGVTYNSGAGTLTIDQNTAITGVNITIVYSGSGAAEIAGGLVITGGGAQPKSVVVVVELPRPVELTAIKTTGTQYFDLGYTPNPNTKFEFDVKFEKNSITDSTTSANNCCPFLSAPENSGKYFIFQTGLGNSELYSLMAYTNTTNPYTKTNYGNEATFCQRGTIEYENGSLAFLGRTQTPATMSHTAGGTLLLGYGTNKSRIFDVFNMYVYGLKIYEGSTLLHDFKPVTYQGTPGLWDDVNDTFISSASGVDPIEVE